MLLALPLLLISLLLPVAADPSSNSTVGPSRGLDRIVHFVSDEDQPVMQRELFCHYRTGFVSPVAGQLPR